MYNDKRSEYQTHLKKIQRSGDKFGGIYKLPNDFFRKSD